MQVDFYQLSANPVEQVLPRIAERLVGDGGRLLIVADDDALLSRLDSTLWSYKDDSFLPHAIEGAGDEAEQPVLLSRNPVAVNQARHIAIADGEWRDQALEFDRAFHLFDAATLDGARAAWRALADRDGVERRFWKQDERGKWSQVG